MERQRQQADKTVAEARPNVDKLEAQLAEVAQAAQARAVRTEELEAKVVPLRKEAAQLRDGLSEAKLSAATLRERDTYTARIVDARGRDVAAVDAAEDELKNQLARKIVAQRRIAPLLAVFEELTASARRWTHNLEQRAQQAQDSSAGLHAQVTAARERAKAAHDAYDDINARLSAARVEKGRLEVRVDAAVNSIVQDMGVPLETALALPELDDRGAAEENAFKLRRRIANMGAINPDAAQEYEQLRSRYDYLAAQLADLDGARRSACQDCPRHRRAHERRFRQHVQCGQRQLPAASSPSLFPGGSAELVARGPRRPGEHRRGGDARSPRGKRITKMMLMSGGEKSLTALALAVRGLPHPQRRRSTSSTRWRRRSTTRNLRRLTAYLQSIRDDTQLIMITHQRRTMEMADVLFGVSMQADGVTKVISQKLDHALKYAE